MNKNTLPGYRGVHNWVERKLGKPSLCVLCGTTEPRRYHWANISQEYKRDLTDWRRLCVPCHAKEKYTGYCSKGHDLSKGVYRRPDGVLDCLVCKCYHRRKRYWLKKWRDWEESLPKSENNNGL